VVKSPPDSDLEITVAICTRNRDTKLASVLETACSLSVPRGLAWEICVVDNGSTDNTASVVQSFEGRLPIRYLYEPQAGLSNARNLAVGEARGRYICWTDDDVEIDSDWLAAYVNAFQRHPEAAIFGGRIFPRLEGPTPGWFADLLGRWPVSILLAQRDFGDEILSVTLEGGRVPWGANFAIRASEQRKNLYDPNLGVSPNQKRLGEEAEVIFRVLREGGTGWWVPDAKVHHIIPLPRQSRAFVYDYFHASGETLAYLEAVAPGANHMRPSPSLPLRISGGVAGLRLRRSFSHVCAGLFHMLGMHQRSLYFLSQFGFFSGALAYDKRSQCAGS
jgi:glucosyl-dolichyl phosphate glucuronosyltransferase